MEILLTLLVLILIVSFIYGFFYLIQEKSKYSKICRVIFLLNNKQGFIKKMGNEDIDYRGNKFSMSEVKGVLEITSLEGGKDIEKELTKEGFIKEL